MFGRRPLVERLRDERGFGMVELLAAMTVMLVGLLAVFGMFQAGIVQLRRASTSTTAAALGDAEMERFRAIRYAVLGLDALETCPSGCSAVDALYKGDAAYAPDTAPTTTLGAALDASTTSLTVVSAAGFPASAEFRVKIDNEIVLVTDGGSGTTAWSIKRGQDGTTATTHAAGASVTLKERVDVASCVTAPSPCTTLVPTKTSTGADGKSYRVDTYVTWTTVTSQDGTPGRAVKKITVVIRDREDSSRIWSRLVSIFDESTGV